jgi:hypothetical protein
MSVTVLGEEQVNEHLAFGECIEAMAAALGSLARGEAQMPLRRCCGATARPACSA